MFTRVQHALTETVKRCGRKRGRARGLYWAWKSGNEITDSGQDRHVVSECIIDTCPPENFVIVELAAILFGLKVLVKIAVGICELFDL